MFTGDAGSALRIGVPAGCRESPPSPCIRIVGALLGELRAHAAADHLRHRDAEPLCPAPDLAVLRGFELYL